MPAAILEKPTEKIAFSGEIRDKKLLEVFTEAAQSGLTGVLKLKVIMNEYFFYFLNGSLIYSSSSKKNMDRTVLEIIKYSGFISREKLVLCEKQKSRAMKTALEMLIDEGFVSMLLYSKAISLVMRTNIINAMLETSGSYSFEIKSKVDPVHGVRPVPIAMLKPIETLIEENRSAVRTVSDSLYSEIDKCDGVTYLKHNQSFIHNAITYEYDYLKFFATAVSDFIEKKWSFPYFFLKDRLQNTIAVYTFRTLIIAGLCIFLYFALMTKVFELKSDEISGNDFFFISGNLSRSIDSFQNTVPHKEIKAPEQHDGRANDLKLKSRKK